VQAQIDRLSSQIKEMLETITTSVKFITLRNTVAKSNTNWGPKNSAPGPQRVIPEHQEMGTAIPLQSACWDNSNTYPSKSQRQLSWTYCSIQAKKLTKMIAGRLA